MPVDDRIPPRASRRKEDTLDEILIGAARSVNRADGGVAQSYETRESRRET
jgi:hypothetical protein